MDSYIQVDAGPLIILWVSKLYHINSVDPDDIHILWHLIWVYTFCQCFHYGLDVKQTNKRLSQSNVCVLQYKGSNLIEALEKYYLLLSPFVMCYKNTPFVWEIHSNCFSQILNRMLAEICILPKNYVRHFWANSVNSDQKAHFLALSPQFT